MRVLSVTHGPNVPGGVFDEVVEARGHELERWVVPLGGAPQPAASYDAVMVFGGSMHPDQDAQHRLARARGGVPARALARGRPRRRRLPRRPDARARGRRVGRSRARAGDRLVRGRADARGPGRSRARRAAAPDRDVPVAQLHVRRSRQRGTELARSAVCTQAFRVGERAWGIQFHAEVTLDDGASVGDRGRPTSYRSRPRSSSPRRSDGSRAGTSTGGRSAPRSSPSRRERSLRAPTRPAATRPPPTRARSRRSSRAS